MELDFERPPEFLCSYLNFHRGPLFLVTYREGDFIPIWG